VGSSLLKHQQISRPGGFATETQRHRDRDEKSLCLCASVANLLGHSTEVFWR